MNQTIRTMVVTALILSVGVVQSRSGVVLAGESEQKLQYVYKTIGDRTLKTDILYPDDWKSTDRRAAIVFFSGGAWRSGGTAQFVRQAGYFAKRGLVTVRAEYRDSTKDKVKPDTCLRDAISAMRWVGSPSSPSLRSARPPPHRSRQVPGCVSPRRTPRGPSSP